MDRKKVGYICVCDCFPCVSSSNSRRRVVGDCNSHCTYSHHFTLYIIHAHFFEALISSVLVIKRKKNPNFIEIQKQKTLSKIQQRNANIRLKMSISYDWILNSSIALI